MKHFSDKTLLVHFTSDEVKELYKTKGGVKTEGSVGFDLVTTEDIKLIKNKFFLIPVGVIVKPPEGMRAVLYARSSTFMKWGLMQANSVGIIDPDYCGPEDRVFWPCYCLDVQTDETGRLKQILPKGTPIAQLVLEPATGITVEEFIPDNNSRGGLGSTDKEATIE